MWTPSSLSRLTCPSVWLELRSAHSISVVESSSELEPFYRERLRPLLWCLKMIRSSQILQSAALKPKCWRRLAELLLSFSRTKLYLSSQQQSQTSTSLVEWEGFFVMMHCAFSCSSLVLRASSCTSPQTLSIDRIWQCWCRLDTAPRICSVLSLSSWHARRKWSWMGHFIQGQVATLNRCSLPYLKIQNYIFCF